jgi:hypothetical protein
VLAGSQPGSLDYAKVKEHHSPNDYLVELVRAGAGDSNRGIRTSAPVKDGVGEAGVYVGSFRATYLARCSQ